MTYYEADYDCDLCEDYVNEELKELKGNARDYLIGVMDNLYGKKFDASNLEHCLEELCNLLDYGFKFENHLKVERVKEKDPILEDWKQFNHNYLKAIA